MQFTYRLGLLFLYRVRVWGYLTGSGCVVPSHHRVSLYSLLTGFGCVVSLKSKVVGLPCRLGLWGSLTLQGMVVFVLYGAHTWLCDAPKGLGHMMQGWAEFPLKVNLCSSLV